MDNNAYINERKRVDLACSGMQIWRVLLVSISDANSIIVGAASLEQSLLVIASAVLIEKALNIFLYQHLTSAG